MSDAVKKFCSDPKYAKEIPACNCLTATDMIDKDVKKILARHDEIVKHNKSITEENKEKLKELDKYIDSYERELKDLRIKTECAFLEEDNDRQCRVQGYVRKDYTKGHDGCALGWQKGICGYPADKISNMVLIKRQEKSGSAKYKPEPLQESDVIFGDMKFECCSNTINIGDNVNAEISDVRQQCIQKMGDKISQELEKKRYGDHT